MSNGRLDKCSIGEHRTNFVYKCSGQVTYHKTVSVLDYYYIIGVGHWQDTVITPLLI